MSLRNLLLKLSEDNSYDVSDRATSLSILLIKAATLKGLEGLEEEMRESPIDDEDLREAPKVKEEDLEDSKEDSEWLDKKFDKKSYWDKLKEKINK